MIFRNVARLVGLLGLTAAFLWFMAHYELIEFEHLANAFRSGLMWILGSLVVQVALSYLMMYRYSYVLKYVDISVPMHQVRSAAFVSNGIGQWAPGSIAVIEMIRVALLLGHEKSENEEARKGVKVRVALASLVDRLVGFFVILTFGGAVCLYVLFSKEGFHLEHIFHFEHMRAEEWSLFLMGLVSLGGGLAIGVLPFVSRQS
jgi:hypothetical protein